MSRLPNRSVTLSGWLRVVCGVGDPRRCIFCLGVESDVEDVMVETSLDAAGDFQAFLVC